MFSGLSRLWGGRQPDMTADPDDGTLPKFEYGRPDFVGLSEDEVQVSADAQVRPIMIPRDTCRLPWNAGYAEVINSGKSLRNEDQAICEVFSLVDPEDDPLVAGHGNGTEPYHPHDDVVPAKSPKTALDPECKKVVIFGIVDGHAGSEAAVFTSKLLHYHIQEKLSTMQELLFTNKKDKVAENGWPDGQVTADWKDVLPDQLVTGALEAAFHTMDAQIGRERHMYQLTGGCAVIVALFFLDRLYVANAGDCRAVVCRRARPMQLSTDFTPITERQRLQHLAWLRPHLIGDEFTHLEFQQRLTSLDVGRRVLYRDVGMKGWAYKTVTLEDIKFPLIHGDGKRAKLMATIGVTRGFGDHDLRVYNTELYVKPFLSPNPEVRAYDLASQMHDADDVLILASDGLWDVISNEKACELVSSSLSQFAPDDMARYTSAAQELVMYARGILEPKVGWRTVDETPSSSDDISAFVIPLCCYGSNAQMPMSPKLTVGRPADWSDDANSAPAEQPDDVDSDSAKQEVGGQAGDRPDGEASGQQQQQQQ
ncbi:PREDICTED: protein phosphatase 1H-like isoform X2 [Priapulus caudatus]|uniref:Protein phosphatase 1H-like isoform X2 n=1 Tax=Priapulus caudatus TaxID=37621 RepID=A0ABM1EY41_PRICU|nr:PREDICTED: protein phosphatase 1H-like isoform X2 [Priapulus caudatus]